MAVMVDAKHHALHQFGGDIPQEQGVDGSLDVAHKCENLLSDAEPTNLRECPMALAQMSGTQHNSPSGPGTLGGDQKTD